MPRMLAALTVLNVVLLALLLGRASRADARADQAVLRGRALEIVDDRGKVRASIQVHPAGRTKDGKPYPDTVILRLIDPEGRPEVKLSATSNGAALGLLGASDTTHALVEAEGGETRVKLTNQDGRQQVVRP